MGNGNKAEMLIAICAVITSVIALFVAWDQGRVMRAQQHGAVYPVLQVDGFVSNEAGSSSIGIRLSNSGVGPALIESVRLSSEGQTVESLEPYRARLPEGYELSWAALTGRALAPGEDVVPLELTWPREAVSRADLDRVAAEWQQLGFEVCYCSVFERCWKTMGFGTSRAERVKRCERSEYDIFEAFGTAPDPSEQNNAQVE